MPQKRVKISPTLLDAYYMFCNTEYVTLDELMDRINKVKRPTPPAAMKGTAYNDLIDALILGKPLTPETKKSRGTEKQVYKWIHYEDGQPVAFEFDRLIADTISKRLAGAEMQVYQKASIETPEAPVTLHGYMDYVNQQTVTDLKTTGRYTFPKYLHSYQYKVYLYILRQSGIDVNRGEYLVTDFSNIYIEDYYWMDRYVDELIAGISQFLIFVKQHQDRITNKNFIF